jgi:predicted phosphodiesterase
MLKDVPRAFPGADVYVFGHSHRALVERRDGALFVNPGAACPTRDETPSVARLVVTPDSVEAMILTL